LGFNPEITTTGGWIGCNTFKPTLSVNNNPYGYPISYQWIKYSAHVTGSSMNTASPTFTTNVPGSYLVSCTVSFLTPSGICEVIENLYFKKHYEPKFNYTISCNGTNNYTVNLIDNSTLFEVLPGDLNYNYSTTSGTLSQSG